MSRTFSQLAATQVIMALANGSLKDVDAVAVFPGVNHEARMTAALRLAAFVERPLVVAGMNEDERRVHGDPDKTYCRDLARKLNVPQPRIVASIPDGANTPAQIRNLLTVIGFFKGGEPNDPLHEMSGAVPRVRRIAFVADAWHLTRVVLTWCRTVRKGIAEGFVHENASRISIIPIIGQRGVACSLNGPLGALSESHRSSGYNDVPQAAISEVMRLEAYKDDVGDLPDLLWLLTQNGQLAS